MPGGIFLIKLQTLPLNERRVAANPIHFIRIYKKALFYADHVHLTIHLLLRKVVD